mmetsp:Transcript_53707/g.126459  ORF Transcript_53707/g.126459 Transcript_53707/m.126459 type:complete len:96 (-) Transcript_53707:606-893(-)
MAAGSHPTWPARSRAIPAAVAGSRPEVRAASALRRGRCEPGGPLRLRGQFRGRALVGRDGVLIAAALDEIGRAVALQQRTQRASCLARRAVENQG